MMFPHRSRPQMIDTVLEHPLEYPLEYPLDSPCILGYPLEYPYPQAILATFEFEFKNADKQNEAAKSRKSTDNGDPKWRENLAKPRAKDGLGEDRRPQTFIEDLSESEHSFSVAASSDAPPIRVGGAVL